MNCQEFERECFVLILGVMMEKMSEEMSSHIASCASCAKRPVSGLLDPSASEMIRALAERDPVLRRDIKIIWQDILEAKIQLN